MRFKIIVQARTGSSRLPNKMIIPFFGNKGLLTIVLERLLTEFSSDEIVLATTKESNDDVLVAIAKDFQIFSFRGETEDVLSRFVGAAEMFGADVVVRVCADNPFIMPSFIRSLVHEFQESNLDYLSYGSENGTPTVKGHYGLFAELVSKEVLEDVVSRNVDVFYREHVTNYIYSHPEIYKIQLLTLPEILRGRTDLRFTIDTITDFTLMKELYLKLSGTTSLVALVKEVDLNPSILQEMDRQIRLNVK